MIGITEDLVAAPPTKVTQQHLQPGCSFQLNCQSSIASNPQNSEWTAWQQYVLGVNTGVACAANNWTAASINGGMQSIDFPAKQILTLPRADTILAGTTISIELTFDSVGNVTGGNFNVTPGGVSTPIVLTMGKLSSKAQITTADLAPIVAFQLNLVGPGDGQHTYFTSGAGTIVYTASVPLTPLSSMPSCVAVGTTTGEGSNSTYGLLTAGSRLVTSQSFTVDPTVQG